MKMTIKAKTEKGRTAIKQHLKETYTEKAKKEMKKKKIAQSWDGTKGVLIIKNNDWLFRKIHKTLYKIMPKEINIKVSLFINDIREAMRKNGATLNDDYSLEVDLNE